MSAGASGAALGVVLGIALAACSKSMPRGSGASSAPTTTPSATRAEVVFVGMCDASGAVTLSERLFAVADDEDNVLRVYDAGRGGPPVSSVDVSGDIGIEPKRKKSGKLGKVPEADIEAATRVGDLAFWITSHGLSGSGKFRPERFRFFATSAPRAGTALRVVGSAYSRLVADLTADPRFARFGLERALEHAPKEPGGLNIEGLSERREGGVFVGFRNPLPEGKALLVALENPERVIEGEPARFGDPVLLELGGLGVRSLTFWRDRYLIVAGHFAEGGRSALYYWDGAGAPERAAENFEGFNPEAFFTPDGKDELMLLSDDGSVELEGAECKKLKQADSKTFRGMWVRLPGS